jgi:hypothetical protein
MLLPSSVQSRMAELTQGLVLANVVFRSAVPVDIESVPIDELIRFRVDFEGERVSFYDGISKLIP